MLAYTRRSGRVVMQPSLPMYSDGGRPAPILEAGTINVKSEIVCSRAASQLQGRSLGAEKLTEEAMKSGGSAGQVVEVVKM